MATTPLATTALAQLRYIKETDFGVIPAAGNPKNLRMTGESLAFSLSKTESAEIRADRQTTDLVLTSASASGAVNYELSYAEFDDFLEAVLFGTWAGNVLVNGVTQRSFTIERALNDVNQFFAFRGMTLSKMSMKWQSGSITGGSFDFMGKDAVRAGATQLPGSPIASQTFDVMNGVSGVTGIKEGGAALAGTFIKSLDLSIDNSLRARDAIGTLGAVSIGAGTIKVTGNISVYLSDGTLYDKFLNNTSTSLEFTSQDGAGNGYTILLPHVKYGDAKVAAGQKDQDVMLDLPFTALMDSVSGNTIQITKVAAG
jgi:hypothetical protein